MKKNLNQSNHSLNSKNNNMDDYAFNEENNNENNIEEKGEKVVTISYSSLFHRIKDKCALLKMPFSHIIYSCVTNSKLDILNFLDFSQEEVEIFSYLTKTRYFNDCKYKFI